MGCLHIENREKKTERKTARPISTPDPTARTNNQVNRLH